MGLIFKREFKAFFRTLTGYIFLAAFILTAAVLFLVFNLMKGSNSLSGIFADLLLAAVILTPLIVMLPSYTEQKSGSARFLRILPVTARDTVLGGFFANLVLFAVSSGIVFMFALITDAMGDFNYKIFFASYFMYLVFGAFLLAVCRYFSSVLKNQVIAALAFVFLMALVFLGKPLSALFPASALFSFLFFACASLAAAIIFYIVTKKIMVSGIFLAILIIPCTAVFFASRALLEGSAYSFVCAIAIFDIISYTSAGILDLGAAVMFINITVFLIYLTVRAEDRKRLAFGEEIVEVVKNA